MFNLQAYIRGHIEEKSRNGKNVQDSGLDSERLNPYVFYFNHPVLEKRRRRLCGDDPDTCDPGT